VEWAVALIGIPIPAVSSRTRLRSCGCGGVRATFTELYVGIRLSVIMCASAAVALRWTPYNCGMRRPLIGSVIALLLVALISCTSEATKRKYIVEADKLFSNGKYAEAEAMYERALAIDRRLGTAYSGAGRCLLQLGNYPKAKEALRRALDTLPRNSAEWKDTSVQLAYALVHEPNAEADGEVQRVAIDLCRSDPKSFDCHNLAGNLAFVRAQERADFSDTHWFDYFINDAIVHFQTVQTMRPKDVSASLQLARALGLKGSTEEAERAYRTVMKLDKISLGAYAELYRLLLAQNRLQDAEQVLRDAVSNVPSHQGFSVMLAAQALVTNPATALPLIEQLKSKDLSLPAANLIAGDYYLRDGQLDRAKQEYRRSISARQYEPACRMRLIQIAVYEKNESDLKKLTEETLKVDSTNPAAIVADAMIKLKAGDTENAERELRRVLDSDSEGPLARYCLARLQARQQLFSEATQSLEIALQRKPDFFQARLLLAQLQFSARDYEEAQKSAEKVLASHSGDAQAQMIINAARTPGVRPGGREDPFTRNAVLKDMDDETVGVVDSMGGSDQYAIDLKNSVCDAEVAAFKKLRAKDYERFDLVTAVPGLWSTEALTQYIGN
jgi:tetratricopeptide (TPR) repeat protein